MINTELTCIAFESERLCFEPLSLKFCSQNYVNWLNDPEVYRFLETGGNYTIEKLREYLQNVEKKDMFFWAIIIKHTNIHIGNIKIDPINRRHSLGEYGILLGEKSEWGKGYAKEASLAVIDFCFKRLNLRKMTLGVVRKNTQAYKLYQKLGFIQEGVYRKHGLYDGEFYDIVRMALFNNDWHEPK